MVEYAEPEMIILSNIIIYLELAQFPVTEVGEGVREADLQARQRKVLTSAFIRLAQRVVDAIWLDLGALNQGYIY